MSHLLHRVCQLLALFILLVLWLCDMGSPGLFFSLQPGSPRPSLAPSGEQVPSSAWLAAACGLRESG